MAQATVLTAMSSSAYRPQKRLRPWLISGALLLVCALMLFPVFSTVLLSFKQQSDVRRTPPVFLPCDDEAGNFNLAACRFVLEGYGRVILLQPNPSAPLGFQITGRIFTTYLPNTILYAFASATFVTLIAAMSAYVYSRYRFRLRRLIMVGLLTLAGVPILTMLLAMAQMGNAIRRAFPGYEERLYMIVVYIGFELPIAIWIIKGFFDTIPRELEEAAKIDGCSPVGALWRVVMPLALPGLLSIFLLTFVGVWNEFIANYLLMSRQDLRGAMYGVYDFIAQSLSSYNALAAACVLVMIPVVVIFLFTRNAFFHAMLEGAVKG
ncbi:MAG: carbohydrate ABC transporter permease [Anaerolineae bacterium]|nr:carbohydrate ABC transporter permease [Candidatus Roseilinea sp.]MDW8451162.1 carbohydrate ABC transporter permease [Anaerolineae bacterium]